MKSGHDLREYAKTLFSFALGVVAIRMNQGSNYACSFWRFLTLTSTTDFRPR